MRRADIALMPRIPAGVDYIFTLLDRWIDRARGQRLIARIDLPFDSARHLTIR